MTQMHLFLQTCTQLHTWAHRHTHTPQTVNKTVQSGYNHSKPHKRLPSVSLSLACRSQWASLATVHTTLPKHNNIQHHGLKNERIKYLWRRTGHSLFLSPSLITLSFPLCPTPSLLLRPVNEWFISLNCWQWFMWSCDHNMTACDKYTLKIKPSFANRN